MRSKSFKKSLAASAVLASSVAATAGLTQSAHATSPGQGGAPLTVGQGDWAPDGSRYVYADAGGAIVTSTGHGANPLVVDPAAPGVARSHPTFFDNGAAIVFSETVNGTSKLMSVPAYTPAGTKVTETSPLSFLGSTMTQGTETAPDSNGRNLVFQHHNATTNKDEIWVQDGFGRGSAGPILAAVDGTEPTVSPDGKTVVFVRKDAAGNTQLWSVAWNGQSAQTPAGTPKQLTTDGHDHAYPAFAPNSSRIAFLQGPGKGALFTDVESIAATGGDQRQESQFPAVPSYRPQNHDALTRLGGADRLGTAVAASQARWAGGKADAVVLSRSDQFADALGGSALATSEAGPLLLTPTDHLDAGVKAEITRALGPATTQKTVYVLGGEQALSPAVFNAVKALGYKVVRIAGPDRFATSVAIAKQITAPSAEAPGAWSQPERVLVATGDLFPDALSAGAAAESGSFNGPADGVVILTDDKKMPASTAAYLAQVKAHDTKDFTTPVYGVGGQADTALTSIGFQHTGLVGSDRYATSYLVAKTFFGDWKNDATPGSIGFATGVTWPDALSGGAFMGSERGPLLLVNPAGPMSADTQNYLNGWAPATVDGFIFGGTAALPGGPAQAHLGDSISGPAGYAYALNPKALGGA